MVTIQDDDITMDDLLTQTTDFQAPELGSLIKGYVITKSKNKVLVDLNGVSIGIISGRETHDSLHTIRDLSEGDEISAVVVEEENEEGMIVLSLRKASQQRAWKRFVKAYNDAEIIEVIAQEVNKGGLLLEVDGIKGFIPVSQLAPLHYPRVNNADSVQIVARLQKLIGQKFHVKIINIDQENNKLILSERDAQFEERKVSLDKLKIGQVVEGDVSGIVNFGIFVTFDGLEGLVHISEIAWGHVKNPNDYGKVGEHVKILVIGKEGEKISLSMKRLVEDPWMKAAEQFQAGTKIKGVVNRITPFGAFMKLTENINGLIHLSEISHKKVENPLDFIHLDEEVEVMVINVDLKERRIGLSIKALLPKEEKEVKTAAKTKESKKKTDVEKDTENEAEQKDIEVEKSTEGKKTEEKETKEKKKKTEGKVKKEMKTKKETTETVKKTKEKKTTKKVAKDTKKPSSKK